MRRNWEDLSWQQRDLLEALGKANKRMFRALQQTGGAAGDLPLKPIAVKHALDQWLVYASRSRLAPFVKLARTIRRWQASIEATIEWRITNGLAESNNASIGRIRAAARGFHDPQAFITMVMLDRGGLTPPLPWQAA